MIYVLLAGDLLMLAVFALRFTHLPPQIPLFYSMPWGEQQLADTWTILLLPFFLNLLFFANNFIYNRFFPENLFVRKIIDLLNLLLSASFTLIFIKIILLTT